MELFGKIIADKKQLFTGYGSFSGSLQNGKIYPEWFGAKSDYYLSDGTKKPNPLDNTNFIQQAINCAQNMSDPTTVSSTVVISGFYYISDTLHINRKNQAISLRGENKGGLITSNPIFQINIEGDTENEIFVKHISIKDIIFKGGLGVFHIYD